MQIEVFILEIVFRNILFWIYLVVLIAIYIYQDVLPPHLIKRFQYIPCKLYCFVPLQTYLTFHPGSTKTGAREKLQKVWGRVMGGANILLGGEIHTRTP